MPSAAHRDPAPIAVPAPEQSGRGPGEGVLAGRITRVVDLGCLTALACFAAWTVAYLAALGGVVPSPVSFWAWVVGVPLVLLAVRRWLAPALDGDLAPRPWVPLTVAGALAAIAAVVVRPDLDDASYVVRSTWIAAHGDVRVGDVIFSGGEWPGLPAQTPYLPSFEALLGWLARVSGLSAGTVVYVLVPPLATAVAVWALWLLLRAWRVRRPEVGLLLASLFLVMGGASHASWGNLHLARMWQGKVVFLAVVVPLVFAACAWVWTATTARRRAAALAVLGLASVAAVGLTPAAVFVVPAVVLAGVVPGLVRRRWRDVVAVLAVGAGPSLAAGVVVLVAGRPGDGGFVLRPAGEDPWEKVLGSGLPAVVVLAGAAVLFAGWLRPSRWATSDEVGRWTALAAVGGGLLVAVPALYELAGAVMGTDAIAWRLTWVVPVPALVALLGGLPRRVPAALAATGTAVALLLGGTPLWSPANGASVAAPGTWELPPGALAAARWVAGEDVSGRVLAPVEVVAALGVVQADARPVSSRAEYLDAYADRPDALVDERRLLQRLVDGGTAAADLAAARQALEALDVRVVCHRPELTALAALLDEEGAAVGYTGDDGLVCRVRPA